MARSLPVLTLGLPLLAGPALSGAGCGPNPLPSDDRVAERDAMVRTQIEARGVRDPRVLDALRSVPRHRFVPDNVTEEAYTDRPLPIGEQQTISQPYIVGLMTELAQVGPGDRVLEIGTGSGYQAAVLAAIGCEVWSIEIVEPLARSAAARLESLGYLKVRVRAGDGYAGWPEVAPFKAILITAAPPRIPDPLIEQLAVGGRLIAPVGGSGAQQLTIVEKRPEGLDTEAVLDVRFVPMTGRAQEPADRDR